MSGLEQDVGSGPVDDRLARLLGPGPRHAGPADTDTGGPADTDTGGPVAAGHRAPEDWLLDVRRAQWTVPPAAAGRAAELGADSSSDPSAGSAGLLRRVWQRHVGGWSFGPSQLAVVAVIVVLGLGLAGWSVLRARPVALASGASADRPSAGMTGAGATPVPTAPDSAIPTTGAPTASPGSASVTPSASPTPMIEVHVLGAVKHPGVVELAPGARVQDGLDRAGGTKKSADLGDLNLAQPLADGQQIFIARHGGNSEVRDPETVPPGGSATGQPGSSPPTGPGSSAAAPGEVVNLNSATVEQLDQLPGVGPVTAQKIIDWRNQHGRFDSVAELQEVDGIGPKTYADLAPMVTV